MKLRRILAAVLGLAIWQAPIAPAIAAVASTYAPPVYIGNGSTTTFPFSFQFFTPAELTVQVFDTNANLLLSPQPALNGAGTYDYTVTGTQDPNTREYLSGATVTFNNAPLANHRVTIFRNIPSLQPSVFAIAGSMPPKTIEADHDRAALILQQIQNNLQNYFLQIPNSDAIGTTVMLPPATTRAGQLLCFDTNGNASLCTLPSIGSVPNVPLAIGTNGIAQLPTSGLLAAIRTGTNGAPVLTYEPLTGTCAANGLANDGASCINTISGGNSWKADFPHDIDSRWFNPDTTGATDTTAAINAMLALGSNHKFTFAPGTYLIGSLSATPYPMVTGQVGFHLFCTSGSPCQNIEIAGEGAIITTSNAVNNSNWVGFDYIQHFNIHGFTFAANPNGLPAASHPSALFGFHMTDGRFANMALTGNWGGSTRQPVFFAGNILTDVIFDGINMPTISECYDVAFLQTVTLTRNYAIGAGDNGTGSSEDTCFSVVYDVAITADYPAAFPPSSKTNHVNIDASNDISNFAQGTIIGAGGEYSIAANFHGNLGLSNTGVGIYLLTNASACCLSSGDPVHDITIAGAELNNNPGGLNINATSNIASIANVAITGNIVVGGNIGGIQISGANYFGLTITGNYITVGQNSGFGISFDTMNAATITGNQVQIVGTPTGTAGLVLAGESNPGTITGNLFQGVGTGILFNSASAFKDAIANNTYVGVTVSNIGFHTGATALTDQAQPFANTTPCATAIVGRQQYINDSTTTAWGANITTGGGGAGVQALCDDTFNYTVMGK